MFNGIKKIFRRKRSSGGGAQSRILNSWEQYLIATNVKTNICVGSDKKFLLFRYDWHIPIFNGFINYGDYVQTHAVHSALNRLFSCDFTFYDRDNLSFYQEQEDEFAPLCVMQGWFSHSLNFFPSDHIHPVWIGTHFERETQKIIQKALVINPNYFKYPVGCRDLSTLNFLRAERIPAYFSRCLTLTLPVRQQKDSQSTVYLVNLPEEIKKFLPKQLVESACEINQRWVNSQGESWQISYHKAVQLLEKYRDNAKLVVTSALHCAAPCIAMGIPVILISLDPAENATRFSALSGIKHFYTIDDLKHRKINFDVNAIDIEELKVAMLKNLKLSIDQELERDISVGELRDVRDYIANFSVNEN